MDGVSALTLWWPFYGDMYDDSTQRLCRWGKILMPIAAATYAVYFFIR